MSKVQFEEEQFTSSRLPRTNQPKGITAKLIKLGVAKNEKQAGLIMIGMIVVLLLISWFSISSLGSGGADDTFDAVDPAELI